MHARPQMAAGSVVGLLADPRAARRTPLILAFALSVSAWVARVSKNARSLSCQVSMVVASRVTSDVDVDRPFVRAHQLPVVGVAVGCGCG